MFRIFFSFLPFWLFLVTFKGAAGLHYTLMPPFGEHLMPLWIVGCLMGGCSLVQLLLDVPAGHLLDRFGYLNLLKVSAVAFMCAAVSIALGLTLVTYLLTLFFSIFGWLFFGPGINAYILSHAPKERAGTFISFRDVFASVGIVLSSAVLPFALLFTPQHIGALLFVSLTIAFVLLFFSPKDIVKANAEKKVREQHYYIRREFISTSFRAMKKLNPASTMLLLLTLSGAIFYGIIWFVVPLVIAHQLNDGLLGIGLGIFDFAVVALGFGIGVLADKFDKRMLVFLGLLIFSLCGALLGLNFGWLFIMFGFLATTGEEMAGISLWSWLNTLDREHEHDGVVSGVISLFEDLGWAIGPIAAGILYGVVGPSWAIALGAIPIFITWCMYQFMLRMHPRETSARSDIPRKPHRRRHKM